MLERAERTNEPLTVVALAAQARVSRSWLYTQPDLLAQLRRLDGPRPSAPVNPALDRASQQSLHRRLELAHQRNQLLQAEVQALRTQLARALGERRVGRRDQTGTEGPHGSAT